MSRASLCLRACYLVYRLGEELARKARTNRRRSLRELRGHGRPFIDPVPLPLA
jgi:hypothetical protein